MQGTSIEVETFLDKGLRKSVGRIAHVLPQQVVLNSLQILTVDQLAHGIEKVRDFYVDGVEFWTA